MINDLKDKVDFHILSARRNPMLAWLVSSVVFSLSGIALQTMPHSKKALSINIHKLTYFLLRYIKKLPKPDLVIGHNIGAFYPTYLIAKKYEIPFGIDIEDYHAGESNNASIAGNIKELCDFILPKATYLTAASPKIWEHTNKDLHHASANAVIINNCFSKNEFRQPTAKNSDRLQIVWFSQNISFGRGLEQVIPVIKELVDKAELHLFGNMDADFSKAYVTGVSNITVHEPLPQVQLHTYLANYDIGLAIEPSKDLNNSIAISNKINAYCQAGLYILASNTPAQAQWMKEKPGYGKIINLRNAKEISQSILNCHSQLNELRGTAIKRFTEGEAYSWENESKKIIHLWEKAVAHKKIVSLT